MSYLREKLPEAETSLRDALFLAEPWRKVLWDAADLLVKHGHCKHVLEDSEGRLCIMGAVCKAATGYAGYSLKAFPALDALGGYMAGWNNQPQTTPEEVIAKLREVALS